MAYYLSPIGNSQTIDANGDPLVGGTISTFLAGTSTAETTYTDDTGGTQQGVVMTLNSLGYPTNGPIWMLGGVPLKFIIKTAAGVTQSTFDDISGIGDTATTADQWILYGAAPTYIGATSFSVVGDQTNTFHVGRRTKTVNSGGTVYSSITASAFAAGVTTVTVVNDSGVLDSDLSAVSYGLLTATNPSVPTTYAKSGANSDITSLTGLTSGVSGLGLGSKIQPITASVGSNALTITVNPTTLDFRSATLGSGTVNTRSLTVAASLVISSGSTLGTTSGAKSRIAVLLIDNAGTLEVAAINIAGGTNLDETGVISTTAEGGAGAADSATVFYSTTARSNLPYRVVGYVESTQATAGTWATAPSTIQGNGGQAMAALSSSGYGQTWQDLTASRAVGVTYTNSTGRTIEVSAAGTNSTVANAAVLTINGVAVWGNLAAANATGTTVYAKIPDGATYVLSTTGGTLTLSRWTELR